MDVLSPAVGSPAARSYPDAAHSRAATVEWARHSELTRLRAEVEWLRAERDALAWAVGHDDLTGLANRRLFSTLGPQILAREGSVALMIVDLNGFKPVNDTLGHDAGDEVLRVVARRMARWGGGDLVARIGGDEFAGVLTCRDPSSPVDGWQTAAAVLSAAITEPIPVLDRRLRMTASIGIAPACGEASWVELLRRADLAMYQAKMGGHRYALWDGGARHRLPHTEPPCLEFALFAVDADG
jgi:diguanylate cyclase (GGDEF)-like protein